MSIAKRLIPAPAKEDSIYDINYEYLLVIAYKIENVIIKAGGKPGTDYTFKDIFDWTLSVYNQEKEGKNINAFKEALQNDNELLWKLLEAKL